MSQKNKIQLAVIIVAPADQVNEGDRIFRSHASWMEATHHRDGAKAPELSNPFDQNSAPTGNTVFILHEIYETGAGVTDHFQQASSGWPDFPGLVAWLGKCKVSGVPAAPIINSLW